jgi:23S rRNA pseudouridine1911/1915/1917 synthase
MQILLEDNHCLAVVKPAGLPTQAPAGIASLEAEAKAYLKEKYQKPGNVYLGVPHRLDRPVSGVVLFARNSKAADRLAVQFRERTVTKIYWGIVEGSLEGEGEWTDWLRKVPEQARAEIVEAGSIGAKEAVLTYRVLKLLEGDEAADATALTPGPFPRGRGEKSLVEITLITGRMHQIRVQAASRGYPILGDADYGATQTLRDPFIALHARSLTFLHPLRYEPLTLTAALPEYWRDAGVAIE